MTTSRSSAEQATRARARGVVLIGVLWMVALLSLVAASMSVNMRSEVRLAGNLVAASQARHAAEGGLQLALSELLAMGEEHGRQPSNAMRDYTIGDCEVRVSISSENGKIDLNSAPDGLLDALLVAVGAPPEERRKIIDAIADWRDADDSRRPAGAEDEDYVMAGRAYGAKDGQFESVDELQLVIGITPALFRALKPALTVHSRTGRVNPEAAPRLVLLALLDGSEPEVDRYMALRSLSQRAGQPAPPFPALGPVPYIASSASPTFSVHAQARSHDGATAHASAVVDLRNRDRKEPLKIRDWRREGDALFQQADARSARGS